ncbi:hypothetical protein F2P56_012575 [Juglans regia]|uniref:C-JID domain-containing protein n=1 Tax=Juglans regia TaxID=51240 RepID=A0A834CYB6_JUGRE|nr:hypothetical protein F2P56_012575 [Juglans regia]
MHDLLREMGHEIVRRQSQGDPGRQSRLWLTNDIIRVLKNNNGTNRIEGIVLNSPPQEELHLNSGVFSEMKNLRLLKIIGNVHLSQSLGYLSTELRVLEWHGYPLKSLPMSFPPDKLVELTMCYSHIQQLWQGTKAHSDLARVISGASRAIGIPTWFQNQSMGSSITIRLHPDLDDGRMWWGYTLYVSYEINDLESWESTRFTRLDYEELVFHFVTDEGPLKTLLKFDTLQKFPSTIDMPAGHWLYVPRIWFDKKSKEVDTWSYIEVSITIGNPFMKVEKCGAQLVYEQTLQEFIDAVSPHPH